MNIEKIRREWNRNAKPEYKIPREKRALEALKEECLSAENNRIEMKRYQNNLNRTMEISW